MFYCADSALHCMISMSFFMLLIGRIVGDTQNATSGSFKYADFMFSHISSACTGKRYFNATNALGVYHGFACVVYVHITALNVAAVHDYCMYKIFIACLSYVPCFMWQLTYKYVSQFMLACTNRYLILHGL